MLLEQYELNVRMLHTCTENFAFENMWCPSPKSEEIKFSTIYKSRMYHIIPPSCISGKYFNGTVLKINFDLIFILLNLI